MMSVVLLAAAVLTAPETELRAKLPALFERAAAHYREIDKAARPVQVAAHDLTEGRAVTRLVFPHGYRRGEKRLDMRSIHWWTSGHFPGALWYIYEGTGDADIRELAIYWNYRLAPNSTADSNHDLGFIMNCSYGNARRLLGTAEFDKLLVETADTLGRRFNVDLGLIRSWGRITDTKNFLVIPDNLMNLELLELATQISGDSKYAKMARSHADITMVHHFRPDGSARHVLNYDQATGRVKEIGRGQGASSETAWSRGQSWGIYGYTMMYRMTKDSRYLDFARKLSDYAMNHPNMPADGVPYWDYGAPGEERDSSAAACMASALLELAEFVGAGEGEKYRDFAVKQLLALSSPEYFSEGDEIGHFILKHGVGNKPAGSEVDTPLNYGDYYYLEALVRFRDMKPLEPKPLAGVKPTRFPKYPLPQLGPRADFWKVRPAEIVELCESATKCSRKEIICHTPLGYPVYALYYGDFSEPAPQTNWSAGNGSTTYHNYTGRPAGCQQTFLLLTGVHGAEPECVAGAVNLIRMLETGADFRGKTDPELLKLISQYRFIVVPCLNMDGRAISPDHLRGIDWDAFRRISQGVWKDGSRIGWRGSKSWFPLPLDRVSFPGGYPNADGYNIMHDASPADIRTAEAKAIINLCARWRVDAILNGHSYENSPSVIRSSAIDAPANVKRMRDIRYRANKALAAAGLYQGEPVPPEKDDPNPPSINLNNMMSMASGALAMTLEVSVSYNRPDRTDKKPERLYSFDELMEPLYVFMKEYLKDGLEKPFLVRGPETVYGD